MGVPGSWEELFGPRAHGTCFLLQDKPGLQRLCWSPQVPLAQTCPAAVGLILGCIANFLSCGTRETTPKGDRKRSSSAVLVEWAPGQLGILWTLGLWATQDVTQHLPKEGGWREGLRGLRTAQVEGPADPWWPVSQELGVMGSSIGTQQCSC